MAPHWRRRIMDSLSKKLYEMVVWPNHFLRRLDREVDLSFINGICAPHYKNGTRKGGRPAEEPERVFRALLLMVLYGIPFETALVRQIGVNLAFRWFLRLGILERVFDHSLFYVVRDRLGPKVFEEILTRVFQQCLEKGLVDHEWAFYDCTDIAASATRYSPYERAVILARAVLRLLEERPEGRGEDSSQPPSQASPAVLRLVAETAKEMVKAKRSRVETILKGVERLEMATEERTERGIHRERVVRALVEGEAPLANVDPDKVRGVMKKLKQKMPHAKGDRDARVGHTSRGHVFCGYLSGNVVDSRYGVISATHLEPGNAYQAHAFVDSGVSRQHVERAGRAPKKSALDAAFGYAEVTLHLAKEWPETEVFVEPGGVPLPREQQNIFKTEVFTLTEDDRLLCPNQSLSAAEREMRIIARRKDGRLEYAGQRCDQCTLRSQCTSRVKGPRVVKLHPMRHRHRLAIKAKAQTPEHRAAMKRRLAGIEPIFGHGKTYHCWGKSPYRSRHMNSVFNLLVVIAHDIEKLGRYAPIERQRRAAAI
jgi:transposase